MTDKDREKINQIHTDIKLQGQKFDLFKEEVNKWRTNHDAHRFLIIKWACGIGGALFLLACGAIGSLVYFILTHLVTLNS